MERQHPAVPSLPVLLRLLLLALLSPAGRGSESPQYATVHAESDFEVRHYRDTVWMSAPSDDISFHVATKLGFHRWPGHCVAVRSFSGYARDHNVVEEAEKLAVSLSRSPWGNSTNHPSKSAYSIAQYNSPFRIIGRVNEVWFDVDCRSAGVEAY